MSYSQEQVTSWAFSLEEGKEGELLFNESWDAPDDWEDDDQSIAHVTTSLEDGVSVIWANEKRQYYGFSTETGQYLWGPTDGEVYLNYYGGHGGPKVIYEGKLITTGVGGIVYCYDVETGDTLWTYEANDPYREYLFSNNWWQILLFFTDGKIYLGSTEHSAIEPMPRGAPALCLDATTGEVVWRADGLFRSTVWGGRAVIGDSVMVTYDTYDNRIYAIGKGPSETTVEAPATALKQGDSVIIRGTVMDNSPGTEDTEVKLRFPKGVPAVSDESMSDWMLFVYKQFECPADIEGVKVFVKIQDPNGEYYSETVTVDTTGEFTMVWTPAIVGTYKVNALFEGTKSYYASYDTTSFVVDASPEYPESPTVEEIAAESASRTIAMMPNFPDVPTQEAIADDAARRTIAMLPQYPTPYPPAEIPEYQTVDLVIIVLAIVGIVIGIYLVIKKK
jgi:outer membrane protein assembly factor BamB